MANRRSSRELLMRLLYQMSVTGDWSREAKVAFLAESEEDRPKSFGLTGKVDEPYFDRMMDTIFDKLSEIDKAVEGASDNWKIGRIAKVDLAIIRLAVGEMLFEPNIPTAVSINEAVSLAKLYGSDKSYEFVNGVLGRVERNRATDAFADAGGDGDS
ncbi:MAG: transcription antitermination factor NusB [Clostridiales Family XIII bacterium]|nr:transcription antitermination factor NusB [Clostridiales Family XIII bacterium]